MDPKLKPGRSQQQPVESDRSEMKPADNSGSSQPQKADDYTEKPDVDPGIDYQRWSD